MYRYVWNATTSFTDPSGLAGDAGGGGGGGGAGAGLNWNWGQVWSGGMWGGTNGGGGYRGRSSPGGGNLVPLPSPIMPPPSGEPPEYVPLDGGAGGGSGGSGGGWGGGLVPLPSPPMPPPHDPPRPEPMDGGGGSSGGGGSGRGEPGFGYGGGMGDQGWFQPIDPPDHGDERQWEPMDGGGGDGDPSNPHGGGSVPPWMPSPPMPGPRDDGDLPPWLRPQPMDGGGGDPGNPHGGGSVPPWMPSPPVPGPRDDGDLPPWLRPQPMDGGGGSGGGSGGWFTNWGPGSYPGDRNWNWDWPGSGNFPIEPDLFDGGPGNNGNDPRDKALFDGGGGGRSGSPGGSWGTDPVLWGQGSTGSSGSTGYTTWGISFDDWAKGGEYRDLGTAPLNDDGSSRKHVQYAAIGSQGPGGQGGYKPPESDRNISKNPVMVAPNITAHTATEQEQKQKEYAEKEANKNWKNRARKDIGELDWLMSFDGRPWTLKGLFREGPWNFIKGTGHWIKNLGKTMPLVGNIIGLFEGKGFWSYWRGAKEVADELIDGVGGMVQWGKDFANDPVDTMRNSIQDLDRKIGGAIVGAGVGGAAKFLPEVGGPKPAQGRRITPGTGSEPVIRPGPNSPVAGPPGTKPQPPAAAKDPLPSEKHAVGSTRHVPLTPAPNGSYTIEFESGKKYHGKGGSERARVSARNHSRANNDPVKSIDHTSAATDSEAFKQEAARLNSDGGPRSSRNYNRINSPGKRVHDQ